MTITRIRQPATQRTGSWTSEPGFGVYVHIPFCRHRCHYCDFNTYEGQDALHAAYVAALIRHIEEFDPAARYRPATSVFFGGGTPTLLRSKDLAAILNAIRNRVGITPDAEVTVEANPETVDERKFESLLHKGFNRVSIGVQSLVPHVLGGLGRRHSAEVALAAIGAARRAGVADINADLIYGSPWESPADWRSSLNGVMGVEPDHISAYALTIEPGTPLATLVATGRVPDVDPDMQADRHEIASEVLGAAGYSRYEISNWARDDRASRHNVLYWCGGDYLGFGAGAHAHLGGRRSWSVRLPREFIVRVESKVPVEAGSEVLDDDGRAGEALMLGLRLTSGVDLAGFAGAYGAGALASRRPVIDDLIARGLLEVAGGRLRIPADRVLVTNEIAAALL
jgi:putative oxygen-independent coproporphyrinogen III oxidase